MFRQRRRAFHGVSSFALSLSLSSPKSASPREKKKMRRFFPLSFGDAFIFVDETGCFPKSFSDHIGFRLFPLKYRNIPPLPISPPFLKELFLDIPPKATSPLSPVPLHHHAIVRLSESCGVLPPITTFSNTNSAPFSRSNTFFFLSNRISSPSSRRRPLRQKIEPTLFLFSGRVGRFPFTNPMELTTPPVEKLSSERRATPFFFLRISRWKFFFLPHSPKNVGSKENVFSPFCDRL